MRAPLLLTLSDFFFKTDFRIYVFTVKLRDPLQFRICLVYLTTCMSTYHNTLVFVWIMVAGTAIRFAF